MQQSRPWLLVTGSSGLIGRAVCERLSRTHEIIGFDRAGPPHPPDLVHTIEVDLAESTSVRQACAEARRLCHGRLAGVVHLAAYYDFSGEPSMLYHDINVLGTRRLLESLRGIDVGIFIYSSSMLVHAPTVVGRPINEDSPLQPAWDYPESKIAAETLLSEQRRAMPLSILRIAGLYDAQCHSIPLAHQIQRINERTITSKVFPGDLSHGQAFVHLDDVVSAISLTLHRRTRLPGESVFLIGEPETLSYGELQRLIARDLHGEEWETRSIPKVMARVGAWMQDNLPLGEDPFIKPWMVKLADDHYELDIGRARRFLGWEPHHRLRDFLPTLLAGLHRDPGGWYRENHLSVPLHTALES